MNTRDLKRRLAESRKFEINLGEFTFVVNRPTMFELTEIYARLGIEIKPNEKIDNLKAVELSKELIGYVVDWRGVEERHFLGDTSRNPVKYDRELLIELMDRYEGLDAEIPGGIVVEANRYRDEEIQEKKDLLTTSNIESKSAA